MPVILRLTRRGSKKRPFYRIVAAEKGKKRDGRYLELLGSYSPKTSPPTVVIKEEKVKKWVEQGAVPSRLVRDLIVKNFPGFIEAREKHQLAKLQASRKKRKLRLAKKSK